MATIKIPTPLRAYTAGQAVIAVTGATVSDVLTDLIGQHPGLKQHLFEDGELRNFVNIFVGEENTRDLDGLATRVGENDALRIIPSIAGG
ncbi:MAG TPA: MoaD/ThiS family protein [Aggregatilineaceae bacterium]|jgi:molybdopterin converting factor small subunit|nr:MoaD/ThiS family protein [Aggregatilineaceae bacterium]